MRNFPLWSVPRENAQKLLIPHYFGAAVITYIGVPIISYILTLFLLDLEEFYPTLFKNHKVPDFLETLSVSWVLSWIGFLIALPVALAARRLGLIGLLPMLIAVGLACMLIAFLILNHNDFRTFSETLYTIQSDAKDMFVYGVVFAMSFWLILIYKVPSAFKTTMSFNNSED